MENHVGLTAEFERGVRSSTPARAGRPTQLRNCAAWHMDRMEAAIAGGKTDLASRHDAMAFRLFMQARAVEAAA